MADSVDALTDARAESSTTHAQSSGAAAHVEGVFAELLTSEPHTAEPEGRAVIEVRV